jgi:hypothetical protein
VYKSFLGSAPFYLATEFHQWQNFLFAQPAALPLEINHS